MRSETHALVLRSDVCKENDRRITLLCEATGIVVAYANGARRPKSPLHAATQPFAHGRFGLLPRHDTYAVATAAADGVFFVGLAQDLARLELAATWSRLACALCPRTEPAHAHLRLLLNALHFLCQGQMPPQQLEPLVHLRLLCLAGYAPNLEGDGAYFDSRLGQRAPSPGLGRLWLSQEAWATLHVWSCAALHQAFALPVPLPQCQELQRLVQGFARAQLGA